MSNLEQLDRLPTVESLDDIVGLAESGVEVFVRYSEDPWQDTTSVSYDYEADVELPGVSATVVRPEPWWTRPAIDWVARRICKYLDLAEKDRSRRPWLLTGRVVGNGGPRATRGRHRAHRLDRRDRTEAGEGALPEPIHGRTRFGRPIGSTRCD